jgi:hypothetical protein
VNGQRGEGDAALQQRAADLVNQCRATLQPSNPVHGLHIELLLRLEGTKRMFCLVTASAIASASRKSFFFDL